MPAPSDMARLTRIHVRGFRSLADVELSAIGPRALFIGPNGSGKSNLLSALRLPALAVGGGFRLHVGKSGGASALLHYGPKTTPTLSVELDFAADGGRQWTYRARWTAQAGDALVFETEQIGHRAGATDAWSLIELGQGHSESALAPNRRAALLSPAQATARACLSCVEGLGFFHVHDTSANSELRTHSRAAEEDTLRPDGRNLGAYLARLRDDTESRDAQAAWRRINGFARRLVPALERLDPAPVGNGYVRLGWVDHTGHTFGAEHLSDGSLRAIALITALTQPIARRPAVISIDEPELGLHPAALALIADLTQSAARTGQVLVSTQSSDLLNLFDADEVWVCEHRDGVSSFRRLDPDALASWLAMYRLSDLFDKNVLGGRP